MISLPFFKISLIQLILCKACLDLLLWKLSKLLVYMLDLGYGFGFTKSLRIPNLIKVSEIESVMLPDK